MTVDRIARYVAGLRAVIETFPDFHWDIQQLLVDDDSAGCAAARQRHDVRRPVGDLDLARL